MNPEDQETSGLPPVTNTNLDAADDQAMDVSDSQSNMPAKNNHSNPGSPSTLNDDANPDPDIQVDNTTFSSPHSTTLSSIRPTYHTSKRKHVHLDPEEADKELLQQTSERRPRREIKPFNHRLDIAIPSMAQPSTKTKSRSSKRSKTSLATTKSEEPHACPRLMGSKYMHFNVIDLMQIEACKLSLVLWTPLDSSFSTSAPPPPWIWNTFHWYVAHLPIEYPITNQSILATSKFRTIAYFYVLWFIWRRETTLSSLLCKLTLSHFTALLTPSPQHKDEAASFVHLLSRITSLYSARKLPRHVSLPDDSAFRIMKLKEVEAMTPSRLQIQLQKGIIVVPDMNCKVYSFSSTGIRSLNSLNIDVNIEGAYDILHSHRLIFWHNLKINHYCLQSQWILKEEPCSNSSIMQKNKHAKFSEWFMHHRRPSTNDFPLRPNIWRGGKPHRSHTASTKNLLRSVSCGGMTIPTLMCSNGGDWFPLALASFIIFARAVN